MAIQAIALLQLQATRESPASSSSVPAAESRGLRIITLDDAVLLHLGEDFSLEPDALSRITRGLVGEALDVQHTDPRGILFIPEVALPSARTYEAVVAEVGEGGVWGPLPKSLPPVAAAGGLEALLGNMIGQLPSSVLESATAAAHGDPNAFRAMSSQLESLMGSGGNLHDVAGQLASALGDAMPKGAPRSSDAAAGMAGLNELLQGAGIDPSSASFQQMFANVQSALQRDPAELARMAEQLFGAKGGGALHEDDHEDGDDDEDAK